MLNFSRRINGATYYAGIGVAFLAVIGASLLSSLPRFGVVVDTVIGLTIILVALALFVYLACLIRQRSNDIGWHPLLVTVVSIFTPLFLILGLIPGQKATNRFGAAPRSGINLKP